jgi:signal transduction histidine kinase/ActR/RegA family two-component response regulator
MMPRLDGFGLLREIRADQGLCALPVILLSARAGEESRVEGMQAIADDYLVKPFGARELLARVSAHLQIARLRREAERAIRESEERFRAFVTASSDVVYRMSADWSEMRFLHGREFMADTHEPSRTWLEKYIDPDDRPQVIKAIGEAIRTRHVFELEHRVRRVDGSLGWTFSRAVPLLGTDGAIVEWLGAALDVTARKRAEEGLREADRRKNEFLATLAHELRNPLAPIRNALQIIRLSSDRDAREQARTLIERQLGQMVRLVDDLMDVSRISRGKVELRKEQVELAKVVQQAVETSRPLIEAMGHDLTLDMPPMPIVVNGDLTRLAQAFANLLNNAAKYTERGGRITLRVEQQGSDAVVSVRDTGVGIPAHMLPKVFEMFTQVHHSLERSQGGLGIGLSLVKGMVEMHGGGIEARSAGHGKGSEFVVHLPVVVSLAGQQRGEDADQTPTAPKARRRILVADDNRDSADSLALLLKIMGNDTHTAHDGLEVLEVAASFRPDVILLDIGMPKLNGYETARRIRQQAWGSNVLLVAQTGWGQEDDKRLSKEAGFDVHMVKPVDPTALEKLLTELQASTA